MASSVMPPDGPPPFLDAARLFARHEENLDVYHSADDGPAFNFQKQWEDRPRTTRPTTASAAGTPPTWTQGYALHWL
ncbi:MAG: hypothetical protein IPN83_26955 [Holophagales bacterium]|nr:hypothetical protein [Holophagales bacterium]